MTSTEKTDKGKKKLKIKEEEKSNSEVPPQTSKKESTIKSKKASSKEKDKKPTKEELLDVIKNLEAQLKLEKDETKRLVDIKQKEFDTKEKIYNSLYTTNNKLVYELDILKKQMEDREKEEIEKERLKKTQQQKKQENPLEVVIRVKEKELEDAVAVLDRLRKENNTLKASLSETSDYHQVVMLENRLTNEENKFQLLSDELKMIEKFADDRKKQVESTKMMRDIENEKFENEVKNLKAQIKKLSKAYMIDDKEYNEKTTEMVSLKRSLLIYEDKHGIRKLGEDLIQQKAKATVSRAKYKRKTIEMIKRIEEVEKEATLQYEKENDYSSSIQKNKSLSKSRSKSNRKNRNSVNDNNNINKGNNTENENKEKNENNDTLKYNNSDIPILENKLLNFNNVYNSKSNNNYLNKNNSSNAYRDRSLEKEKNKPRLFETHERDELEQFLPQKTVNLFENRYIAICHSKESEIKKFNTNIKILTKKVQDVEEKIELNLFLIKEEEQKAILLGHQIEELQNDNKLATQNVQELIHQMNDLKKAISDKEIENKSLINEMKEMKSQFEKDLEEIINPPEIVEAEEDENVNEEIENEEDD